MESFTKCYDYIRVFGIKDPGLVVNFIRIKFGGFDHLNVLSFVCGIGNLEFMQIHIFIQTQQYSLIFNKNGGNHIDKFNIRNIC